MISNKKHTGVSVVLGYVLLLIVTSIGISVLLVGFQGIITNTSNTVAEDEAKMASTELISEITTMDSNIANTDTTTYQVQPKSNSVVRNSTLQYTVEDTPEPNIYVLQTSKVSSETVYTKQFKLENTSFNTDTVGNSSSLTIEYNSTTNTLSFT